ncbi:hypothetical protein SBADM41S_05546 [Streptomyces badius]
MAIASRTWTLRKAASSWRMRTPSALGCSGTSLATPSSPTTPRAATTRNVVRQPAVCPRYVPRGTPTTLATVSPVNIMAMAPAFFCGATRSAATTEPMPKKAPCAREAITRPASMTPKTGASADTTLPTTNSPMSSISMRLRETRVPSSVISGAPRTTPSA